MEEYQELLQVIVCRNIFPSLLTLFNPQVKTALDMEIAVYKQLLETEEGRLGITPDNALSKTMINLPATISNLITLQMIHLISGAMTRSPITRSTTLSLSALRTWWRTSELWPRP